MLKLKNGAKLVRLETRKQTSEQFVLAYMANNITPWATWAVDSEGFTYWGNYFKDEASALLDLARRVGLNNP
jgi:hypothetical protein